MDLGMISRRYAKALFMYAKDKGQERRIDDETRRFIENYDKYPALKRILSNLTLSAAQKEEVFDAFAGGGTSEEYRKFARLLIAERREEFMQMICLSYRELYRVDQKIRNVDLVTAVPMEEDVLREIVAKLSRRTGQSIILNTEVNPAIIGGYIIRDENYRLDASVANRLLRIKRALTETTNNLST